MISDDVNGIMGVSRVIYWRLNVVMVYGNENWSIAMMRKANRTKWRVNENLKIWKCENEYEND